MDGLCQRGSTAAKHPSPARTIRRLQVDWKRLDLA